jgi:hypothetical protein
MPTEAASPGRHAACSQRRFRDRTVAVIQAVKDLLVDGAIRPDGHRLVRKLPTTMPGRAITMSTEK